MPLLTEQRDNKHSTFLDGIPGIPESYQGPHVPMQLSCVAEEEDCEVCSGCLNQVLIPTPDSAHEKASFIARENPYFPVPRAKNQRCLSTVLCRSVSIQSLPSDLQAQIPHMITVM
jgi:hypothetical protein